MSVAAISLSNMCLDVCQNRRTRTRLVGAEDVGAGHLLHGGHARDNGAFFGERAGAQRERDRQHGGHRDGDAADHDDQHVEQRGAAVCASMACRWPVT